MVKKVKTGIIGCGNISKIYFENCKKFASLEVVACADLDLDRARERAEEFDIPNVYTVDELLNDDQIELVINLTIPAAHAEICERSLLAGKHVYVEKPLSVTLEEGQRLVQLAKEKGLRLGSAPETFMGGGLQTSKKMIDDGWIGQPVAAVAFMMSPGHEHWHPNPEFYYQQGGGPLFDMGPYYITALVNLFGPIRRISGSAKISFPQRVITSEPKNGTIVDVEVPTHVTGILDFANGTTATLITSFDIKAGASLPNIEVYGSLGSMQVPDPNRFGNPVYYRSLQTREWKEIPLMYGYTENSRGIGAADMAYAIRSGRPHRAHGEMAYHVLEAMHGIYEASETGRYYEMKSTFEMPAQMPDSVLPFTLDE